MNKTLMTIVAGITLAFNANAQEKQKMNETSPLQVVEIQKQIELLKAHKGASPVLTMEEVGGSAIIQLARVTIKGKTSYSLNIATNYPSPDKPAKALAAVGMTLPQTWQLEAFEPEEAASFTVPEGEISQLPQFIHNIFVKFLKRQPTYKITCNIENM